MYSTHFGDRRTNIRINGQTDGQHQCVKPLARYIASGGVIIGYVDTALPNYRNYFID